MQNARPKLRDIIKEKMLDYIKDLSQQDTKKMPSEENLAKLFNVSRITIRAVLSELESEGIVARKQGYGTYISNTVKHLDVQFNPVTSYDKMIADWGYQESSQILDTVTLTKAPKAVGEKLKLAKDQKVIRTNKIFYADQTPCVYCVDYFALDLLAEPALLQRIPEFPKSIFEFLGAVSPHRIVRDYTQIGTKLASEHPDLTKYFLKNKSQDMAFLELACINYDQNDDPVIYAEEYVDTKFIKFFSVRKKNS